ncbi:MAG: hypothetical protein H6581_04645 [Bacteroidia bacterium]|nr:hypothetical protein [Bacteroidia bacterium]
MKKIYLFLLVWLCVASCQQEKVTLCESPVCDKYITIWENLFKSRNQISDEWFNQHVSLVSTETTSWVENESFLVHYQISIDWAKIDLHDKLAIKIHQDELYFPKGTLPLNLELNEAEINLCLDHLAFGSQMATVNPISELRFSSRKQALAELERLADHVQLKPRELYFKKQKPTFNANGNPYLPAFGVIDNEANQCISGEIDLVTGIGEINLTTCRIY